MPVRERLEDLDLALEVVEQLRAQRVPLDRLDCDCLTSALPPTVRLKRRLMLSTSTHLVVALIHRCEAPLPNVPNNNIRSQLILFGLLNFRCT